MKNQLKIPAKYRQEWKKYFDWYLNQKDDWANGEKIILHDLCFWEVMKDEAAQGVEDYGAVFLAKSGYTQSTAYYTNLVKAQDKIDSLRGKLFTEAKAEKKPELNPQSFDEFVKLRKA